MKTSPHIFKTAPHLKPKVWGGRRLETLFAKSLPAEGEFGESWEVADLEEGQSRVDSGPLEGLPLRALSKGWGRSLVGRYAPRKDRFPLLVKLLDAHRDLSVQVHPDRKYADEHDDADSKRETWLILDADADAEIVHGLVDEVSEDEFREAAESGRLERYLRRIAVNKGDVIDIEPGTIHAICGGVALLEIQEPSDTTYRVYDYDRPGLDGNPRQLHVDRALEVARLERSRDVVRRVEANEGVGLISETPAYRIERLDLAEVGPVAWNVDPRSPQTLHLLEGVVTIEDGIGGQFEMTTGETAVVPAVMGTVRLEVKAPSALIAAGLPVEQVVRDLHRGSVSAVTS